MITGIIALLLEAKPNLTWRDIKHILASSANQVDPPETIIGVGGYVLNQHGQQTQLDINFIIGMDWSR